MKTKLAPILFFLSALIGFGQYNVQYDVTNYNLRQKRIMGSNVLAGSNIVVVRNTNNGVLTIHGLGASSNTVLLWIGTVGTNSTNYAATIGTNATNYASLASSTVGTNATNYANLAVGTLGTNSTNYANSMFGMFGTNSTNYANSIFGTLGTNSTNFAVQLVVALGTNTTNYAASGLGTLGTNATNYANWVSGSFGTNTTNALVGKMDMLNGLSTNQQTFSQTNTSAVFVNGPTMQGAITSTAPTVLVISNGFQWIQLADRLILTNPATGKFAIWKTNFQSAVNADTYGSLDFFAANGIRSGSAIYAATFLQSGTFILSSSYFESPTNCKFGGPVFVTNNATIGGSGYIAQQLHVSNRANLLGGLALVSNPKSTNAYYMTSNDCVVPVRSGCTNVMLPLAATCSNQVFTIKDADGWGAVSNIYICAQAGDWIESGTNIILGFSFDWVKIISLGGTNFVIEGRQDQTPLGTIKNWDKSRFGVPNRLPYGWMECSGAAIADPQSPMTNSPSIQTGPATPVFLLGDTSSGTMGGTASHTHVMSLTASNAVAGLGVFALTDASPGDTAHIPPYYTVVRIQRFK